MQVILVDPLLKLNFQLRLRCAATAMRERCDFHRSKIAIGNAFIDYTVFIPRIRTRIAIAAHAHRSARASQSQLEIKL
jgi:hypothetical protein